MSKPVKLTRQQEEAVGEFAQITGASVKVARQYIEKFKRLDAAVDAYYSNPLPTPSGRPGGGPSTTKINALFDQYKDPDPVDPNADLITVDGTMQLCEDLGVPPEDVILLALAYELKSPRMGEWPRKGWIEGMKSLGVDSIEALQETIPELRQRLSTEPSYFAKVYQHTFEFGRAEGQRSLAFETAKAFWEILIPTGLEGGALSHIKKDDDGDYTMEDTGAGWTSTQTQWWFDFLESKGTKGVSKDTWAMFLEFIRTIDPKFKTYDMEAAWPSTIDDFVEHVKERIEKGDAGYGDV